MIIREESPRDKWVKEHRRKRRENVRHKMTDEERAIRELDGKDPIGCMAWYKLGEKDGEPFCYRMMFNKNFYTSGRGSLHNDMRTLVSLFTQKNLDVVQTAIPEELNMGFEKPYFVWGYYEDDGDKIDLLLYESFEAMKEHAKGTQFYHMLDC